MRARRSSDLGAAPPRPRRRRRDPIGHRAPAASTLARRAQREQELGRDDETLTTTSGRYALLGPTLLKRCHAACATVEDELFAVSGLLKDYDSLPARAAAVLDVRSATAPASSWPATSPAASPSTRRCSPATSSRRASSSTSPRTNHARRARSRRRERTRRRLEGLLHLREAPQAAPVRFCRRARHFPGQIDLNRLSFSGGDGTFAVSTAISEATVANAANPLTDQIRCDFRKTH